MARHATVAEHVHALLGVPVISTGPVAGGDICAATRARLGDGRSVFVKTHPHAPAGFFATEATGLAWLAEGAHDAGDPNGPTGVATPMVLAYADECLVLEWIESGRPTTESAQALGRALAVTHRRGADCFGFATDGFVGTLSAPNRPADTWAEFFAVRRLEPYLRVALRRGSISADDAKDVWRVIERLPELAGPPERPARLHGDLWSGNIVWAADGIPRLVDPAVYGGHRETDLAMLALFGAPHLDQLIAAYDEVYPLADGWRDRIGLHQLHPLLVHAVHFGGGYGARAGKIARSLLGA